MQVLRNSRRHHHAKGQFPASFTDAFTYANGALPSPWVYSSGIWTVAANAAVCTPTLGAELLTNGNMETGDPPNNWTPVNATLSGAADERTGGAGAQSLNIARNGNNSADATQTFGSQQAMGTWLLVTGWERRVDAGGVLSISYQDDTGTFPFNFLSGVTWAMDVGSVRTRIASGQKIRLRHYNEGADGLSSRFDDVSVRVLTLAHLFATVRLSTTEATVTAAPTLVGDAQAGVVTNLDDYTNPQNFVIAHHDGTNAYLTKCVAGTYTQLISAAAAYAAGRVIEARRSGTTYQLWYNGVQIGANQTINDAGIVGNRYHGLFNTYSGNSLDNFSATPT